MSNCNDINELSPFDTIQESDFFHGYDIEDIKIGDKFFVPATDLRNPCINRQLSIKEFILPESFYRTATLIIKEIKNNNNDNIYLDGYIYPALYCFRQYLELTIKDSTRQYKINYCNANPQEMQFKGCHNLSVLFDQLKKCEQIIDEFPEDLIKNVSLILKEIDVFEENVEFRYVFGYEKVKGVDIVKYNYISQLYDIDNMENIMKKLYNFFDRISLLVALD